MTRLTRAQQAQIEQYLADAIGSYPVPEEHYAYVSTLMTHIQADFCQALMEFPLVEDDLRAENAALKAQLKKAGKAYGRASEAIGHLRRDLGLARLYRTCWARAKASDCPSCRRVFADTPLALSPDEVAALNTRWTEFKGCGHLPQSGITIKSPSAIEDDAEADAVLAQELADDDRRRCAAAYADSGRDTGHALCGCAEGPIAGDDDAVSCLDCVRMLENGWGEEACQPFTA
jgi:hypothetical protein